MNNTFCNCIVQYSICGTQYRVW